METNIFKQHLQSAKALFSLSSLLISKLSKSSKKVKRVIFQKVKIPLTVCLFVTKPHRLEEFLHFNSLLSPAQMTIPTENMACFSTR